MKIKLPKSFIEAWCAALRDKKNADKTPYVVAACIDKESYREHLNSKYMNSKPEFHYELLSIWLNKGPIEAANWIEQNVELI